MEIKDLLAISAEIRDSVRSYLSATVDSGEIIRRRERDVTRRIDLFAEGALEDALASRNHCARVISEELGDRIVPDGGEPEFTLIFDPIDGSTNAILGIPFFCTSIAYSSKLGRVTFPDLEASVVASIYGKTYYAIKGGHAHVDGKQLPCEIKGKIKRVFSIYTYGANSVPEAVLHFQRESKNVPIRVLGSIALELCLVAEGALDAVVDVRDLINGYDIAGALLILKEAGGMITDLQGKEITTEVGETHAISLIAALEPEIYHQMRALMG